MIDYRELPRGNGPRRIGMALALLVSIGSVATAGCGDDGPTEVVVSIDAESTWRASATTLRVVVRGAPEGEGAFEAPARDVSVIVGAGESYAWPVRVTVAPKSGETSRRWSVEATATNVGNQTATVRVRGSYVSGRTLRVALLLEDACEGVVCAADRTCTGGVCVDSLLASVADGGVDAGSSNEGGVPEHCVPPEIRVPDSNAGTLNVGGTAPTYPPAESCPSVHSAGQVCPSTPSTDDFCFSARAHGGVAFCRTPCSFTESDGGVRQDDPVCATIHPDSHCTPEVGLDSEPDRSVCSMPCNPFDDVGCPAGLHCNAIQDSTHESLVANCVALDPDPRHHLEPCAVVDGDTYPSITGCAPGYLCGYGAVCSTGGDGYVCLQLCDPDLAAPRVECPASSGCYRLGAGAYQDTIGPVSVGRCLPQ